MPTSRPRPRRPWPAPTRPASPSPPKPPAGELLATLAGRRAAPTAASWRSATGAGVGLAWLVTGLNGRTDVEVRLGRTEPLDPRPSPPPATGRRNVTPAQRRRWLAPLRHAGHLRPDLRRRSGRQVARPSTVRSRAPRPRWPSAGRRHVPPRSRRPAGSARSCSPTPGLTAVEAGPAGSGVIPGHPQTVNRPAGGGNHGGGAPDTERAVVLLRQRFPARHRVRALAALICFVLIVTIPFGVAAPAARGLLPLAVRAHRGQPARCRRRLRPGQRRVGSWWAGWWARPRPHPRRRGPSCVTIIGIPFGIANFKLMPVAFWPLGPPHRRPTLKTGDAPPPASFR